MDTHHTAPSQHCSVPSGRLVPGPARPKPTASCFLLATVLILTLNQPLVRRAHSVIMPLPKTIRASERAASVGALERSAASQGHSIKFQAEDEPYQLTINEADSLTVGIKSSSLITINLNRAVPEGVDVQVTVNSGPNMIVFDQKLEASTSFEKKRADPAETQNAIVVQYKANTFGDQPVAFRTTDLAGHAEIVCHVVRRPNSTVVIDDQRAFISVNIYRSWNLTVIIQIVGWIYFFAWSSSFYFQLLLNYSRKSVVGLNFDFLTLNLLGFTCYSIYNFSLMFSYAVQKEYYKRYAYTRIPVEYNDLFFSVHAFAITLITVGQCYIYERGGQQISLPAGIFASLAPAFGLGLFIASLFESVSILDVVLYLSYVKLAVTTIKYAPQAYMNYKRRATTGWSIHNIILDFTGGSFSILQMLLLAYNYDDWISIFGNFTKFGLGLVSMLFDVVFLLQHYVLYRPERRGPLVSSRAHADDLENSSESCPSPIISHSIRSANQNQSAAQLQQQRQEVARADTNTTSGGEQTTNGGNESAQEENSDSDELHTD